MLSGGDILLNLRILIKSRQSLSLLSQILRNAKILIFVYIEEAKLNLIIFPYFSYISFRLFLATANKKLWKSLILMYVFPKVELCTSLPLLFL